MYFDSFPKIDYTINGKTEELVDIFRRVAISKTPGTGTYTEIVVTDSDTIESLAEKYYGDANYSWVIAVTNNMINPLEEFPKSSNVLRQLYDTKYEGTIFYFEENISLQEGDVLIAALPTISIDTLPANLSSIDLDTSKFCFVNSYSNEFRYARVTNISDTFSTGDKVVAFRKINDSLQQLNFTKQTDPELAVQDACVMPIKKVDSYLNSPVYIYNTSTLRILSPYRKYELSVLQDDSVKLEANGTYEEATDNNAFRQSILYKIVMDGGTVSDVSLLKLKEDIENSNEKFRRLKIIPNEALPSFLDTFTRLIASGNINSRLISTKV
jgi:hypothetical protein